MNRYEKRKKENNGFFLPFLYSYLKGQQASKHVSFPKGAVPVEKGSGMHSIAYSS